jgi:hypothetical protein
MGLPPREGDNDVAAGLTVQGGRFHHLKIAGIGADPIIHHRLHPGGLQNLNRPLHETGLGNTCIGDHKNPACAKIKGIAPEQFNGAIAKNNLGSKKLTNVQLGQHGVPPRNGP